MQPTKHRSTIHHSIRRKEGARKRGGGAEGQEAAGFPHAIAVGISLADERLGCGNGELLAHDGPEDVSFIN